VDNFATINAASGVGIQPEGDAFFAQRQVAQ
jgi:hypothetical protein